MTDSPPTWEETEREREVEETLRRSTDELTALTATRHLPDLRGHLDVSQSEDLVLQHPLHQRHRCLLLSSVVAVSYQTAQKGRSIGCISMISKVPSVRLVSVTLHWFS